MDVVTKVEKCPKGRGDKPIKPITIADSGELPVESTEEAPAAEAAASPVRAEL
jgi:hypothetical protein